MSRSRRFWVSVSGSLLIFTVRPLPTTMNHRAGTQQSMATVVASNVPVFHARDNEASKDTRQVRLTVLRVGYWHGGPLLVCAQRCAPLRACPPSWKSARWLHDCRLGSVLNRGGCRLHGRTGQNRGPRGPVGIQRVEGALSSLLRNEDRVALDLIAWVIQLLEFRQ